MVTSRERPAIFIMQIDNEIREQHLKQMSAEELLSRYAHLRIHASLAHKDFNLEAYEMAMKEAALYEREILFRMEYEPIGHPENNWYL